MKTRIPFRKIFSSLPVIFVSQAAGGLLLYLLVARPSHIVWTKVLISCVAYGIVSTITIYTKIDKDRQTFNLSRSEQLRELAKAMKTGKVPSDKEVKQALPAYMTRTKQSMDKQRKKFPLSCGIFGFMTLMSILDRNLLFSIIFGLLLGYTVYSRQHFDSTEEKLFDLQKKLQQQGIAVAFDQILDDEEQNKSNSYARSASILLAMLVPIAIALITASHAAKHSGAAVQQNVSPSPSPVQPVPVYTAAKYNFKINYPGKPSASDNVYQPSCNASLITYTDYSSFINDGTEVYTIDAATWPKTIVDFSSLPESDLRTALKGFVNADMQTNGATLVSLTEKRLLSSSALAEEAKFTIPEDGYTITGYDRVFIFANNVYDIMTQDSGQTKFNQFADSFQYTSALTTSPKKTTGSVSLACLNQSTLELDGIAPVNSADTTVPSTDNSLDNGPTNDDSTPIPPNATLQLQ